MRLLLISLLLIVPGCTHAPMDSTSPGLDRPPGAIVQNPAHHEEAVEFDRLLREPLTKTDLQTARTRCDSTSGNPFCPSIRILGTLRKLRDSRQAIRPAVSIKPVIPIHADIKSGKIRNWKHLRNANVQGLIKGLLAAESKDFHLITDRALQESSCPNNIAIATAATLEDLLPDPEHVKTIAGLYERGARCARHEPVDREHFFTRAALLHLYVKDYKSASKLLAKVNPTDAFSGRALYWLFQAKRALGETKEAQAAFDRLVSRQPFSFHALVAQKSIGQDPGKVFLDVKPILQSRTGKSKRIDAFIYQAELLTSHGLESAASTVADWLLNEKGIEPRVRLYIASLGDARARVVTASDLLFRRSPLLVRETMELVFPRPYFKLFDEGASGSVTPYLGLAVARKESVFNTGAVSVANAQGLLQLNPDTALKLTGGRPLDLFEPRNNIDLGMRYLHELSNRFSGKLWKVLAAYNAGEDAVGNWEKRFPDLDPVLWIDLIPYRETRDYVGLVLTNYFWYQRLYETGIELPGIF